MHSWDEHLAPKSTERQAESVTRIIDSSRRIKAAKAIGVELSTPIQLRAIEVIE
jgi:hypothetical protein